MKGTNFLFTLHTEVSAAEVEVLPVPDLTDLPSCNLIQQHAVQLSSLVKQPGQIRDAATQASKAVLNNKLSKEKMVCVKKAPRGQ